MNTIAKLCPSPTALILAAAALLVMPLAHASERYTVIEQQLVIFSAEQLEELVGPVALYPDDLLAILLPASTYPRQIEEAARFLEDLEYDPSLQPSEHWDESVVALLNYPEALQLLYEDPSRTDALGAAVLNQQPDVIAAIESFRDRAYRAGNLRSDSYQRVVYEDDSVRITPVEEQTIYVPYYEPRRVVVVQREPVYHYYPRPYPIYHYPYPARHSFRSDFFWGVTTAYTIGWRTGYLHVHDYRYASHPYFGRRYVDNYYYHHRFQRPHRVNSYGNHRPGYWRDRHYRGDRWQPRRRNGNRLNNEQNRARHGADRNVDVGAQRDSRRQQRRSTRSDDHLTRQRLLTRQRSDETAGRGRATRTDERALQTGVRNTSDGEYRSTTRRGNIDRATAQQRTAVEPRPVQQRRVVQQRTQQRRQVEQRNVQQRTQVEPRNVRQIPTSEPVRRPIKQTSTNRGRDQANRGDDRRARQRQAASPVQTESAQRKPAKPTRAKPRRDAVKHQRSEQRRAGEARNRARN
ncbi:MAG: DUF3300 domain-containing protein [Gammaproteobacteria bacterium]|nr:DUF3300 domain-containing protein [Gammaproteobacteria bacterium]